ncbi:hypothetical protein DVH24_001491 [Malus domestica]|uniref:Myb-like domain-containing protein n=1 Tax=Malus domestica TaxID=3750 RepID=A0A498K1I7_MALDO|nr:hypothetical protein DVH24_001491 [Malus domestica]
MGKWIPVITAVEDSFDPALEDESETIEHLLVEPKSEYVTVDGVLCGLHSAHPWGRHDEFELGVLDGLLDEVDEVEDIHAINDIGFIGQASELGFGSCEGSRKRNSCSANQCPGLSGSGNSAVGISESSTVTIQEFECKNNSIDKAVTHEFHNNDEKPSVSGIVSAAFLKEKRLHKPTRRYIEEFPDKMSKDSKGREDCSAVTTTESRPSKVRSQNKHHHLRPRTLASVPEDDLILKSRHWLNSGSKEHMLECDESDESYEFNKQPITFESEDDYVSRKRSSKKERVGNGRLERRKRRVAVIYPSHLYLSYILWLLGEKEFGICFHLLHLFFVRVRAIGCMWDLGLRVKTLFVISILILVEFLRRLGTGRRLTPNQMWTPSEVTTLVDGISQYGVGRWTYIKRFLFASSPYRTPLDLRVEQKEMRALPKSLVPRVRELATVHPYPRQRGKKFAPPILPIASKSASSDHIRTYVRRKNRFQSSITGAVNQ